MAWTLYVFHDGPVLRHVIESNAAAAQEFAADHPHLWMREFVHKSDDRKPAILLCKTCTPDSPLYECRDCGRKHCEHRIQFKNRVQQTGICKACRAHDLSNPCEHPQK